MSTFVRCLKFHLRIELVAHTVATPQVEERNRLGQGNHADIYPHEARVARAVAWLAEVYAQVGDARYLHTTIKPLKLQLDERGIGKVRHKEKCLGVRWWECRGESLVVNQPANYNQPANQPSPTYRHVLGVERMLMLVAGILERHQYPHTVHEPNKQTHHDHRRCVYRAW